MSRIEQYVRLTLDQRSGPSMVWVWAPDVQRVDEYAKGGSGARAVVHTLRDKLYVRETPVDVLEMVIGIPQVDRNAAASPTPAGSASLDTLAEAAREAYWGKHNHSPWAECGAMFRKDWLRVAEAVLAANASTPLTRDMPLGSVELAQALYAVEYGYSSCSEALYHTDQQTRTIYAARANKLAKWLAGRRLAP